MDHGGRSSCGNFTDDMDATHFVGAQMRIRGLNLQEIISAVVTVGIMAPILWMAMDRSPPFEIVTGHIEPMDVPLGGSLDIVWHVRPLRLCSLHRATVTRSVIDSIGIAHRYAPVNAQFSGETKLERSITLPPTMAEGPARYSSLACYPCNPLQELWPVCVQTPELKFNVVGGSEQSKGDTK